MTSVVGALIDSHAPVVVRESVRLASALGAELHAVFVEDEELLSLAGYDFASCVTCGRSHELHQRGLEHEWRALAQVVREEMAREAHQRGVSHRFEVVRARSADALRAALEEADLVLVGWGGFSPKAARGAPVRVLHDGSESAARALTQGARLAGPRGQLAVWLAPGVEVDLAQLAERVGRVRVASFPKLSVKELRRAVALEPGGLLLVPTGGAVAEALAGRSAAARFSASVVLAR